MMRRVMLGCRHASAVAVGVSRWLAWEGRAAGNTCLGRGPCMRLSAPKWWRAAAAIYMSTGL